MNPSSSLPPNVPEKLQEWIKRIISHADKEGSTPTVNEKVNGKSCMDAHRDVLHLEAEFQVLLY
jgi:hypothetical protein